MTVPGTSSAERFDFAFAPSYRLPAMLFGVLPHSTWAELDATQFRVRFGLWRLITPTNNIADVSLNGGFGFLKTAGPAHLSFKDRGVTFATNGDLAVCLKFHEPVAVLDPTGRLRHPGATITLADPERFVRAVASLAGSL